MDSSAPPSHNGVNKCYMFKSRLQEFAQKAGFNTPEYQTVKEGASHDPEFRSTVVVNGVSYESLPRFCTRKEAEQSAAEVALLGIVESGQMAECIPSLHETGLCKNLLQEYAQKMNFAIPSYISTKQGVGPAPYICTVEIGGIQYIGASARTKKESEIKAARTALLAIQSLESGKNGESQYTVIPIRKKPQETEKQENSAEAKKLKPKKNKFKKKWNNNKKKLFQKKNDVKTEDGSIGEDGGVKCEIREEKCEEQVLIKCESDLGANGVEMS
ncbi:hypothetical protein LUZ60_010596 [Juncus effusus]|nr:hypothetical protein LUZ60_010596 [Juncus effusus]